MNAVDRLAEGYEPNHDIDREFGHQGELWVADLIETLKSGSVEVKHDARFHQTGNLYIETECLRGGQWRPSGLTTTTAELWVHVLFQPNGQPAALVIPVALLRDMAARHNLPAHEMPRGSHPTRGLLLPISFVVAALRLPLRWEG